MVIKKSVRCNGCKNYIDIYVGEKQSLKNRRVRCQCGIQYRCVEDFRGITKWRAM